MTKRIIYIILFFCSITLYAQEQMDSLFYLNGNIEIVNISKNSSKNIECTYPNETMLSVIDKSSLWKIRFKSGRIEVCNDKSIALTPTETADSLFFRNGDIFAVNVVKSLGETIEYSFLNEDSINIVYKTQLAQIKYSNGRIENCSGFLNVKIIKDASQYQDVVVTYNVNDTRGLEKVAELSKASGWGGQLAAGLGYNKAIIRLQKEAAKMKCGLILIHGSPNMINTQFGSGTRVNASAYRIPSDYEKSIPKKNISELTDLISSGKINNMPKMQANQIAYQLCNEIMRDIKNKQFEIAGEKLSILEKWHLAQSDQNKNITYHINKLKDALSQNTKDR